MLLLVFLGTRHPLTRQLPRLDQPGYRLLAPTHQGLLKCLCECLHEFIE